MIAVIADDFTGASEIAGIGLRYGLNFKILLGSSMKLEAQLLDNIHGIIICTDSRSMSLSKALQVTEDALKFALAYQPSLLYKKIDSVLRGYVQEEIALQMKLTGQIRALIVPANPSLKRTIQHGEYFIDGVRINETDFANDPEFPVKSAQVSKMLSSDHVKIIKLGASVPERGVLIGETSSVQEMAAWAEMADNTFTLAGAGDFFTYLVNKNREPEIGNSFPLELPHLYVSGTAIETRRAFIKNLHQSKKCVKYLIDRIDENWLKEADSLIKEHQKLVIAIDASEKPAAKLRLQMAETVKALINRNNLQEIFIEGGSTASAILNLSGIQLLEPIEELARGVVKMKCIITNDVMMHQNMFITVKPGSYALDEKILNLYQ